MKNSRPGEDGFARLLRWAEDGESGPVLAEEPEPEDPDRAEFMDYLEYLDAHGRAACAVRSGCTGCCRRRWRGC